MPYKNKDDQIAYSKRYYQEHKEHHNSLTKINYEKNRKKISENYSVNMEKFRSINRFRYEKYKKDFLDMYGNACACCGESNKLFLTIEHIKGQVGKKKETSHRAYRKAIKLYSPDTYKILCWNCNHASRFGICPHQLGENNEQSN